MTKDKCPKNKEPKEVMCDVIGKHNWKKIGDFSKACKNCGKVMINEKKLKGFIAVLEARIRNLELQIEILIADKAQIGKGSLPHEPWDPYKQIPPYKTPDPPYTVTWGDTTTDGTGSFDKKAIKGATGASGSAWDSSELEKRLKKLAEATI